MFVLYYGVDSEITPPVCTSAYAVAIANANPFRTDISTFTLGLGKVIAPMAFVYAPVLLIVSERGFNLIEFIYAAGSCVIGVIFLSAAVVGYLLSPAGAIQRILFAIAGLILIAPSWQADLVGLLIASPALLLQWRSRVTTSSVSTAASV